MDSADAQVALDSIESVRSAHALYAPTAQEHIRSVERAVREISARVDAEISRRSHDLSNAHRALDACIASEDRNCGAEATAVERAEVRLRTARTARAKIDVASAHYQPTASRFSSFVDSSRSEAASYLSDRRAAIEQYTQRSGVYNPVAPAPMSRSANVGELKIEPGIPAGFAMVPLDLIDDSDGSVRGPSDFGSYTPEDLAWAYNALDEVVMPSMERGKSMDYFRDRDTRESRQGTRSYADTASGFFRGDAIKLASRPDGIYTVENGYHRIWVARQMGRQSIPAKIR